jgi:hypothetical protein
LPIVTHNLPQGFYLRSSGIWTFDLVHAVSFIPLGFAIGKVVKCGDKITMNAFVEPQYSIAKTGIGAPRWQIFGGVNFQFAMD